MYTNKTHFEALSDNEVSFQVLNRLDDGVVLIDREWRYRFLNRTALKLKAISLKRETLSLDEIIEKTIWEVHPEILGTKFETVYRNAMELNKSFEIDQYFEPLDSWFLFKLYPSEDGLTVYYSNITQRKKEEAHRVLSENIIQSTRDAIVTMDTDAKITSWNKGAEEMFGFKEEEVIGKPTGVTRANNSSLEDAERVQKVLDGSTFENFISQRKAKDGSLLYLSISLSPIKDTHNEISGVSIISRNITALVDAEEALKKSERLYAFLSAINQCIVHIKEEKELLQKACEIAESVGNYKVAWFGTVDENNEYNTKAMFGNKDIIEKYRNFPKLDFDSFPLSETPTGKVLATKKYAISNDTLKDDAFSMWKDEMEVSGLLALISLPIFKHGKLFGIMSLYSSKANYFEEKEIKLLLEATEDISFGIEMIENEKKRRDAEEKLLLSEKILNQSQELALIGSFEFDFIKNNITWSVELFRIFGYLPFEVETGQELFLSHVHPEDLDKMTTVVHSFFNVFKDSSHEFRIITKTGLIKHISAEIRFELDKKGNPLKMYGTNQDITKRVEFDLKNKRNKIILDQSQQMARVGSSEIDLETGESIWSDEQFRILGYEPNEVQPSVELYLSHLHPDEAAYNAKRFNDVFKAKKDDTNEYRIVTKTGEVKHLSGQVKFEFDSKGVAKKMYGTTQDITARVEAEEKLKYSDTFSRAVIDSLSSHVGVLDTHGNVVATNDAWNRFGAKEQLAILPRLSVGDNLFRQCEEDWDACDLYTKMAILEMKKVLSGEKAFFKMEYPSNMEEQEQWFLLRIMKFDDNNEMIVVAHENITNVKIAENERDNIVVELENRVFSRTKELHEINTSFTDSINYAKRIQSGVLTSPLQLKEIFKKSFLLTKPCNILSGDFFWCLERDDLKFIVVADCTGHGVPAAIMSVVGNTLLTRIIKEGDLITDPATILYKLDRGLLLALPGDDDQKVMDGMDLAICVINSKEQTIHFAGALRPLFVLDTNGSVLELQGTRSCVGRGIDASHKKTFETREFHYTAGQTIYLTSDGYYSQFGGENGKKMMKRLFKSNLKNLTDIPINKQAEYLDKDLINWQGDLQQTDDVLVIGIQLE